MKIIFIEKMVKPQILVTHGIEEIQENKKVLKQLPRDNEYDSTIIFNYPM